MMNDRLQTTAQQIAQALGETKTAPRSQIAAIVRALGPDMALRILHETQEIERHGGMCTVDGTRRRTPGGVFFSQARTHLTPEQRATVFRKPRKQKR